MLRLEDLREERGLTQNEIAEAIGTSRTNIGRWEKGLNEPSYTFVVKLANFFNVTVDYLIGNEENVSTVRGGSPETFTEEERTLIRYYRAIGKEAKNAVFATAESFFNMLPDERRAAYPY